jgi:hypothetical protein
MSDNDMKPMSDLEKQVEDEIENARSELTTVVLAKQKEVIKRMGEALEKIRDGEKRSSICEELKVRLREEIKRGLISEKTIEAHSEPEWKNPAKSKAGKKGAEAKNKAAESAEISAAESAQQDAILVRTDGSVEGESAGNNEGSRTPRGSEPVIRTEGSGEAGKEKPASDNGAAREQSPRAEPGDTLSNSIEFEFWLSFDALHEEMQKRFTKDGSAAKIWIGGVVDAATGKVLSKWVGRDDDGDSNLDNEA